ncbi:MAG: hypothetical protein LBD15_03320 [Holosporales bacterium]|nr:hypothetical protein [Holosporales bacterium]
MKKALLLLYSVVVVLHAQDSQCLRAKDIRALELKNEDLQKQLDDLKKAQAQAATQAATQAAIKVKVKEDQLQSQLEQLQKAFQEQGAALAKSQRDFQEQKAGLEARLQAVTREKAELESGLKEQLTKTQKGALAKEKDLKEKDENINALSAQISELRTALDQKEEEHRRAIAQKDEDFRAARGQIEEREKELAEQQEEHRRAIAQKDEAFQAQEVALAKSQEDFQAQKERLEARLQAALGQIEKSQRDMERLAEAHICEANRRLADKQWYEDTIDALVRRGERGSFLSRLMCGRGNADETRMLNSLPPAPLQPLPQSPQEGQEGESQVESGSPVVPLSKQGGDSDPILQDQTPG